MEIVTRVFALLVDVAPWMLIAGFGTVVLHGLVLLRLKSLGDISQIKGRETGMTRFGGALLSWGVGGLTWGWLWSMDAFLATIARSFFMIFTIFSVFATIKYAIVGAMTIGVSLLLILSWPLDLLKGNRRLG